MQLRASIEHHSTVLLLVASIGLMLSVEPLANAQNAGDDAEASQTVELHPITGAIGAPGAARHNDEVLVAWFDFHSGNNDLRAVRVSASGELIEPPYEQLISTNRSVRAPVVAASESGYLIVWAQMDNTLNIHALALNAEGKRLHESDIALPGSGTDSAPAIASIGDGYLVAWSHRSGISPYRFSAIGVDATGEPRSDEPFRFLEGNRTGPLSIASNGEDVLLVWGISHLYAARLDATAALLEGPTAIGPGSHRRSIATDGESYLIVSEQPNRRPVAGFRIGAGGLSDVTSVALPNAGEGSMSPLTAFDGHQYLVMWNEYDPEFRRVGAWLDSAGNAADDSPFEMALREDVQTYGGNMLVPFGGAVLTVWRTANDVPESGTPGVAALSGALVSRGAGVGSLFPISVTDVSRPSIWPLTPAHAENSPRNASCQYYSASANRMLCYQHEETLDGAIITAVIADLESQHISRFVIYDVDSADLGQLSSLNDMLDDAIDWEPVVPTLQYDPLHEARTADVEVAAGVVISLNGYRVELRQHNEVIHQFDLTQRVTGEQMIRIYHVPGQHSLVAMQSTSLHVDHIAAESFSWLVPLD